MRLSLLKSTLLLILFAIFSGTVSAQLIYSPGYIIQKEGTRHGLLSHSGFGKESKLLYFKETENSVSTSYTPKSIDGFFYEGELYESAVINTEVSVFDMSNLDDGAELRFERDTVFLIQLVKGEKSLYFFNNRVNKVQFYIKIKSEYELLLYKRYMLEGEGKRVVYENNKYIGQLGVYMMDCPEIINDLKKLKYSKTSLSKLFWKYNDLMDYTYEVTRGKKALRYEYGVKAGLNLTSLKLSEKPYYALLNLDDARKIYPAFGVFLNTYLQRNRQNLSLYNELYYTEFYATGQMEYHLDEYYHTISDSKIDYMGINMLSTLRYAIPAGGFNINLNAGIAFPIYSDLINVKTRHILFYTTNYEVSEIAIPYFKPSKLAAVVGIGATYNKFSFDVRFEKRGNHSDADGYKVNMSKLYFLAGYRF